MVSGAIELSSAFVGVICPAKACPEPCYRSIRFVTDEEELLTVANIEVEAQHFADMFGLRRSKSEG
ncbi:hypothetical protein [Sphingorhabdus sp. M41]|uniref:hypothetical protein n=1 Tax=Sphingorhabdus sp. M41 TaxID=1806885 RepID=UPI00078EBCD9|nr:hypothetical protein [Sphingorhabdus sp. M41]AMO72045.1 hypothetical protein AZE99_09470 [Sphingorhabdus sp. M41]